MQGVSCFEVTALVANHFPAAESAHKVYFHLVFRQHFVLAHRALNSHCRVACGCW